MSTLWLGVTTAWGTILNGPSINTGLKVCRTVVRAKVWSSHPHCLSSVSPAWGLTNYQNNMKPLSGRQAPCLSGTRPPDCSISQDKISGEIPIVWAPLSQFPDRQREAYTILFRISSFLPSQSHGFSQKLMRPQSKSFNFCKSGFVFFF